MADENLRVELSVMEQHAEQLRAEVMDLLFASGEEYTEALSDAITDACRDENLTKRIFGMLAEIGFCDVFARAGREMEEEEE